MNNGICEKTLRNGDFSRSFALGFVEKYRNVMYIGIVCWEIGVKSGVEKECTYGKMFC